MKDYTAEEIIDKIISLYGEEDLDGHGKNHIIDVYNLSMKLLGRNDYDVYDDCVRPLTIAAIYHDLFSKSNRKEHAKLAADYVLNDNYDPFLKKLSIRERTVAAYAISKHRSSDSSEVKDYKAMTEFKKHGKLDADDLLDMLLVAEILRAADKGIPNLDSILDRAISHTLYSTLYLDVKKVSHIVHEHICRKFGRGGYIYDNSPFYNRTFEKEIEKLWTDITELSVEDVKDRIKEIMNNGKR